MDIEFKRKAFVEDFEKDIEIQQMLENKTETRNYYPVSLKESNVIINKFKNLTEIVRYKNKFKVPIYCDIEKDIDRTRKFIQVGDLLLPTSDSATLEKLQRSIMNSSKRAYDNIFGYALSNEWKYFVTLTYSPEIVSDREDYEVIVELWTKFRDNFKKLKDFKNAKILAVWERHKPNSEYPKGAFHLHCLFGDCDFKEKTSTEYVTRAFNSKTGEMLFSHVSKAPVYNFKLWNYGFTTVIPIEQGELNQIKSVNYLAKYINKNNQSVRNKKKYFRTFNLDFKNKSLNLIEDEDFDKLLNDLNYEIYKDNNKMTVYRIKPREI